jgi:hypothetical protein
MLVAAIVIILLLLLMRLSNGVGWWQSESDTVRIADYLSKSRSIEFRYCLDGEGDRSPASTDFVCTQGGCVLFKAGTQQSADLWRYLDKERPRLRDIGRETGMWPDLRDPRPDVFLLVQEGFTGLTRIAVYRFRCVGISMPDGRWRACEEDWLFYSLRLMITSCESSELETARSPDSALLRNHPPSTEPVQNVGRVPGRSEEGTHEGEGDD